MASNRHHRVECAFAGRPWAEHGELPWPAAPGAEMCICRPLQERGTKMGTNKRVLEQRIANLLSELDEVETLEAKFGTNDDYPNECVISWKRQFDRSSIVYTYVALKVGGRWFITGNQARATYSFEQLVETHLQYAVDGEVFYVTEWSAL